MVLTTVAFFILSTSGISGDVIAESLAPVAGCPGGKVKDEGGGNFSGGGAKGLSAGLFSQAVRASMARAAMRAVCFTLFPCFGIGWINDTAKFRFAIFAIQITAVRLVWLE